MAEAGFGYGQVQRQGVGLATVREAAILQAAGAELSALIAQALDGNPFLSAPDGLTRREAEAAEEAEETPLDWLDAPESAVDPDHWDAPSEPGAAAGDVIEKTVAASDRGLRDVLCDQLLSARLWPGETIIARALIEDVDEAGYLAADPKEIAANLGVAHEDVASVMTVLRGFEPSGAFARNLKECLRFQAEDQGLLDPAMEAVLHRLDMLADGRLADIARRSGVALEAIETAAARLRRFDPRPGLRYGPPADPPSPPELLVERGGDEQWRARVNGEAEPGLKVENAAYDALKKRLRHAQEKAFARGAIQEARFLARALRRRGVMLARIGDLLVERQARFFDDGLGALVPFSQADAAAALEVHPSTVSRALAGKRLRCPRGLFDLVDLFPAPVSAGAEDAAAAIKERIRGLIAAEDPAAPIGDEALVDALAKDGLTVARRTVAKYRDALGLAPARKRGRRKALRVRSA